jgi:hypothetical protein
VHLDFNKLKRKKRVRIDVEDEVEEVSEFNISECSYNKIPHNRINLFN